MNESTDTNSSSWTVLVVDDSSTLRASIRLILQSLGLTVIEATDGVEALQQAREHLPDLIFLDVIMPGKDGLQVLVELKADLNTQHIPVCMLTAVTDAETAKKAVEFGASDYLPKPTSAEKIQWKIAKFMSA